MYVVSDNWIIFRARYLDSRALSKLGVYIPKPDLNSFFIRDEFDGKYYMYVSLVIAAV